MKHLAILAAAIGVMFYLARGTVVPGPYTYDEPDYMYAAALGWVANAADSPSMPLDEFVRLGLEHRRASGPSAELSESIRNSGDVVFYRHWHGPVYSAWLALVSKFGIDERHTREWNFVFPVLTAAMMYFGAIWLLPGAAGQIAAILAAVFYLWSYPAVRTSELAPHQLFALCVTAVLLLMCRLLGATEKCRQNPLAVARGSVPPTMSSNLGTEPRPPASGFRPFDEPRRYWYAAVAICAVAFCVLEIDFALIFAVLVCGHLVRDRLKPGAKFALRSMALFCATVLVLWPAALLKLSFIKAYLFMAYLALARTGSWGPRVSLAETWSLRFVQSPVVWIAAAFGLVYFLRRRGESRILLPLIIFVAAMTAAILPVKTAMPRYALPLWPGVILLGAFSIGLATANWKPSAQFTAVAALCFVMAASGWPSIRSGLPQPDRKDEALLALIRENGLAQKTALIPHGLLPMVHYYFPDSRFRSYYDESAIPAEIRKGGIDGIIEVSDPPRWIPVR